MNGLLNKDGNKSFSDTTTYNIAALQGWNTGSANEADTTDNNITVSNYTAPSITSATYDYNGTLTVTGARLASSISGGNDINASKLTIKGSGEQIIH
jgi:hypothetical protein